MRKVREKIMARAMISRSCANFLSDVDVKPGIAQAGGALNKHQHQKIRFRSKYDCSSETDIVLEKRGSLLAGSMEHARFAKRATLDLEYRWFRFRESRNGFSMLAIWDKELPATICAAGSSGNYRLLDLVDFSDFKPLFFVRSNPVVHSLKNVTRMRRSPEMQRSGGERRRCKALLITMKDEWSKSFWGYWSPEEGYLSTMDAP